jgi:hypothetical protein
MSLRIPLAMNQTEGYMEEVPSADTVDLRAGANIAGNLVFSSGEPTGLPGTPSGDTAAASKAYVDAVAAGLNPRPYCRVASNEDFDAFTPAGSGVGATLTSPTTGTVENDVDGVTVAVGDRVLVKDYGAGSSDADNGIYEVTQLADGASNYMIMTRATDFDENDEVNQGDSVFVAEGSVNAKRTYALITADPITVDTTAQEWSIVSGPGLLSAGAGLLDTANTWSVELHTAAAATGAGTGGGSSGLEFDTSGDGGKLRAAVSATGALQRAADGLAVKLEATNPSLQVVSNELGVKLDPARAITKNSSGIGVNVEATNPSLHVTGSNELSVKEDTTRGLNTDGSGLYVKVDGTTITYDGSGQLKVGAAPASVVKADYTVNEAIALGDAVNWSTTNDRVEKSRADTDSKARVIGIAETAQGTVGQTATIVSQGPASNTLSSATAGNAYYLQATGGIGTSLPGGGNRIVQVGIAKNSTDLFVRIVDYGKKAA